MALVKNEIINKNETTEQFKANRSEGIRMLKAEQMTNMLESVPFTGNVNKLDESLNFLQVRRKLSIKISLNGEACLVLLPLNKRNIVVCPFVINYTLMFDEINMIQIKTSSIYSHNGIPYPLNYMYSWENGIICFDKYIEIPEEGNKESYLISRETYPHWNKIPAKLFKNNMEKLPDSKYYKVESQMELLDKLSREQFSEYNKSKQLLYINSALSGNEDGKLLANRIKNGDDFLESIGFGGKLGNSLQMGQAGGSLGIVQGAIMFLENDIYHKLHLESNELVKGKTNKHNLEVIMAQKDLLVGAEIKRNIREKEYRDFFAILNNNGILKTGPQDISLQFDIITQSLLQILQLLTVPPTQGGMGGQ